MPPPALDMFFCYEELEQGISPIGIRMDIEYYAA
ncbi:MAG: hypothetical protein METHAR1v1_880014 [Methanothrix sp.]|nr:MAG: hypothetical protein METHAR1v1_880014 [Methanothrix sp.]